MQKPSSISLISSIVPKMIKRKPTSPEDHLNRLIQEAHRYADRYANGLSDPPLQNTKQQPQRILPILITETKAVYTGIVVGIKTYFNPDK